MMWYCYNVGAYLYTLYKVYCIIIFRLCQSHEAIKSNYLRNSDISIEHMKHLKIGSIFILVNKLEIYSVSIYAITR